ncbi:MAG TPA: ion transporter [Phnomibacter sp.]|nr:ion transporter [Phnomibacter sp.]
MQLFSPPGEKLGFLNLLVLLLSAYVLMALAADTFFKLPPEVSRLLQLTDNVICGVFLLEFMVRFSKAPNKAAFMRWGWIDLLSSIPMLDYARAGRLLRLIRLLRIIRAFKSLHLLLQHLFRRRQQGTLTAASLIAVLVILLSSIAILQVEDAPESNIKTAEDAIWWAYATVTTVGYGDRYPVTTEGRLIAALLMTVGVGLFGTFTAYVASWFVGDKQTGKNSAGQE